MRSAKKVSIWGWTLQASDRKHPSTASIEHDADGARIAQLVEQRIENPRVGGSNPSPGTTYFS
jgi:hypothetical protein